MIPHYDDVVLEVVAFLKQRAQSCIDAGIDANRIALDPGFGFGKTMQHNLQLLAGLPRITDGPYPVLIGLFAQIHARQADGRPVAERLAGSSPCTASVPCMARVSSARTTSRRRRMRLR